MRNILCGLLALLAGMILMSGCGLNAPVHAEDGGSLTIKEGQSFVFAIGSNPAAGAAWLVDYDHNALKLAEKKFEAKDERNPDAGGTDYFRFEGVLYGQTLVTLNLRSNADDRIIQTKIFKIMVEK